MKTLHRELQYINPMIISFDQNNPRGLSEEQITMDSQFDKLVLSIETHGILEPLIVKPNESDSSTYVLIDGERRLRAALRKKLNKVPVLAAENDTDGRILAYQVHMLRENWSKAAETKAIKKIISDLKNEDSNITDVQVTSKLKEITAHKPHEITDLLKLIKYPDEVIDKVISKELDMSYLVQIESSFINPLKRHYKELEESYGEDKIRMILIQKALDGKLINTRFLMDKFKVVFNDTKCKKDIVPILTKFLDKKATSISETLGEYENLLKPKSKKKTQTSKKSEYTKTQQETDTFTFKPIKLTTQQQTLKNQVREKFENIGMTFTDEEKEYISEALSCLEKGCHKAATIMIWASGIHRILTYIDKNLADFNTATDTMHKNPKSVYKHIAKIFQKNAITVDDIRLNGNDRQLLSYLLYKNFITITGCKKLFANYDKRCDCAHPTDIKLSPNEVIALFENVYDLILNNSNLK